jgi:hypothetical protein
MTSTPSIIMSSNAILEQIEVPGFCVDRLEDYLRISDASLVVQVHGECPALTRNFRMNEPETKCRPMEFPFWRRITLKWAIFAWQSRGKEFQPRDEILFV